MEVAPGLRCPYETCLEPRHPEELIQQAEALLAEESPLPPRHTGPITRAQVRIIACKGPFQPLRRSREEAQRAHSKIPTAVVKHLPLRRGSTITFSLILSGKIQWIQPPLKKTRRDTAVPDLPRPQLSVPRRHLHRSKVVNG